MFISLNGPDHAKYNATRAVARWLDSGQRLRRPEIVDSHMKFQLFFVESWPSGILFIVKHLFIPLLPKSAN